MTNPVKFGSKSIGGINLDSTKIKSSKEIIKNGQKIYYVQFTNGIEVEYAQQKKSNASIVTDYTQFCVNGYGHEAEHKPSIVAYNLDGIKITGTGYETPGRSKGNHFSTDAIALVDCKNSSVFVNNDIEEDRVIVIGNSKTSYDNYVSMDPCDKLYTFDNSNDKDKSTTNSFDDIYSKTMKTPIGKMTVKSVDISDFHKLDINTKLKIDGNQSIFNVNK